MIKGVRFRPELGKWSVYVGDREYLGCYESEEDAALAYNLAAFERFGVFACLNEISTNQEQLAGVAKKLRVHRRRKVYRKRKAKKPLGEQMEMGVR